MELNTPAKEDPPLGQHVTKPKPVKRAATNTVANAQTKKRKV